MGFIWVLVAFTVLCGLVLFVSNGGSFLNRWLFVLLPVAVGIFLISSNFETVTTSFGPVKLVSVCFGAWLIAMMRFRGWAAKSWTQKVVFAMLALNIAEAVVYEVFDYFFDATNGLYGGSIWNGLAGILLLVTQAFPRAISIDTDGRQDFRYDLGIGWVLAYTLWNFTFVFGTLAPEQLFDEYMAGTVLHLGVPLILILVMGRDTSLFIQLRTISLGLFTAAAIAYTPEPIFPQLPQWHSPELADILATSSFTAAVIVAIRCLIINRSRAAAVNLQHAVRRKAFGFLAERT